MIVVVFVHVYVCVLPWVQAQAWQGICHHSHRTSEGRSSGKKQKEKKI